MGSRGRKPSPKTIALLPGQRADRTNSDQPAPVRERPQPPASFDPVEVKEFNRVADALDALGVLSSTDADAIALYVDSYLDWIEARKTLAQEGSYVDLPNGTKCMHPAMKVKNQAFKVMDAMLKSFGLSPAARTRVNVLIETPSNDALSKFLAGP